MSDVTFIGDVFDEVGCDGVDGGGVEKVEVCESVFGVGDLCLRGFDGVGDGVEGVWCVGFGFGGVWGVGLFWF